MAVDFSVFCLHSWGCVVQRKPGVDFLSFLAFYVKTDTVHRHIFAPKPTPPALNSPGELQIINSRVIAKTPVVDKSINFQPFLLRKVLKAFPEDGQGASFSDIDR